MEHNRRFSDKKRKCSTKCLALFSYSVLLLSYAALTVAIFWMVYPYKTVDYFNLPYKMSDKVVYQGQDTFYTATYCKYTDIQPIIQKEFIDGLVFKAEEKRPEFESGCHTSSIRLHIPETLPAGKYKLRATAIYRMNPLRTIYNINETEWFEVKERK